MSLASTSSSQAISAVFAADRAVARLLPAPANSTGPVSSASRTSRVLPDPHRQASLGDKAIGRSRQGTAIEQTRPDQSRSASDAPPRVFLSAETLFAAQVLGQPPQLEARPGLSGYEQSIKSHRDAAELGSRSYRLAGGQPEILSDRATFLSLAI